MLDENQVVEIICNYLTKESYIIEERRSTTEKGIDVVALNQKNKSKLLIEVKGGTSSRKGSERYGKPFNSNQLFDRVAKGVFTTFSKYVQYSELENVNIGMAFPDNPAIRKLINSVKPLMDKLDIIIFLAKENGDVLRY